MPWEAWGTSWTKDIFNEGVGTIKGFQAKLHVKSDVKLRFFKPRSVPYALRSGLEDELDRLEHEGYP